MSDAAARELRGGNREPHLWMGLELLESRLLLAASPFDPLQAVSAPTPTTLQPTLYLSLLGPASGASPENPSLALRVGGHASLYLWADLGAEHASKAMGLDLISSDPSILRVETVLAENPAVGGPELPNVLRWNGVQTDSAGFGAVGGFEDPITGITGAGLSGSLIDDPTREGTQFLVARYDLIATGRGSADLFLSVNDLLLTGTMIGTPAAPLLHFGIGDAAVTVGESADTYYLPLGAQSALADASVRVHDSAPPTITKLTATPEPVNRSAPLALTATGVSDHDGVVTTVTFFRETNGTPGLQTGADGDAQVAVDTEAADGWQASISTTGMPLGTHTYYAQATSADGVASADGLHAPSAISTVVNSLPTIASLTATPNPACRVDDINIVANGVADADGWITNMAFYREANGVPGLQSDHGDWMYSSGTRFGLTIRAGNLSHGTYTVYAVATDNDGGRTPESLAAAVTFTVANAVPVVSSFSVPNPTRPSDLTLQATIKDRDDFVAWAEFYREANGIEGLQRGEGGDSFLARDSDGVEIWSTTISTADLPAGGTTFYVWARDAYGATVVASDYSYIYNAAPTMQDFTAPYAEINGFVRLSAQASDVDGTISSIAFYRETNNVMGLQGGIGGDELLYTDTDGSDGWSTLARTWSKTGVVDYYAVASDNDGGSAMQHRQTLYIPASIRSVIYLNIAGFPLGIPSPSRPNLTLDVGDTQTLFLWANLDLSHTATTLGLDLLPAQDGFVSIAAPTIQNPLVGGPMQPTLIRWGETETHAGPAGFSATSGWTDPITGLTSTGLAGGNFGDPLIRNGQFLIGSFQITAQAPGSVDLFLTVNDAGVFGSIVGTVAAPTLHLGGGDGPVLAITGDSGLCVAPGARSLLSDATLTITLRGDINRDGAINALDIPPMIAALTNQTYVREADCNKDGYVNALDIADFVGLIVQHAGNAVAPAALQLPAPAPEPFMAEGQFAAAAISAASPEPELDLLPTLPPLRLPHARTAALELTPAAPRAAAHVAKHASALRHARNGLAWLFQRPDVDNSPRGLAQADR